MLAVLLSCVLSACSADVSPTSADPSVPTATAADTLLRWSNPRSWPSGSVPAAGADVVVPKGTEMLLDASTPALRTLRIDGLLRFADQDLSVTAERIEVQGELHVGAADRPFRHRAEIVLTGQPTATNADVIKRLAVNPGGVLELHGEPRTAWTRLAATAAAGSDRLELARPVDWRAGDQLVVAPSGFDAAETELVTVRAVSGTSVQLAAPLRHAHWGRTERIDGRELDERAEVGLLTRNIVIRGDSSSAASGFGAHVIVSQTGVAHVEHVELTLVGQKKRMGRYPFHWHMAGDVDGQYIRHSSVWRSFNRCVTVHGSHRATVEGNVCYDHLGHGYFLEDGIETGNVLKENLGVGSRAARPEEALLPTDTHAATFWITNLDNTFIGNVAAGADVVGFWVALPQHPTGLSATTSVWPAQTPLREFRGNVAHSNGSSGLYVDDGPTADGQTRTTTYRPRKVPGTASAPVEAAFTGFVAYKNRGHGVWIRGDDIRLERFVLADNGIGAQMASDVKAPSITMADGLIIGASANRQGGVPGELQGFRLYDGPVQLERITFANFREAGAAAIGLHPQNVGLMSPLTAATGLRFVDARPVRFPDAVTQDGERQSTLLDRDGSLTGVAGGMLVPNMPLLLDGGCAARPEWQAHVCRQGYVGILIGAFSGSEPTIAPATVTREDGVQTAMNGYTPRTLALTLPVGRTYTVRYAGAAPRNQQLQVSGLDVGETVHLAIPSAAQAVEVSSSPRDGKRLPVVASLEALAASGESAVFLDTAAGVLHARLVGVAGLGYDILNVYAPR